jgi:hypothetical protein
MNPIGEVNTYVLDYLKDVPPASMTCARTLGVNVVTLGLQ